MTIKRTRKICSGRGKYEGKGCGKPQYIFSNGLCRNCWNLEQWRESHKKQKKKPRKTPTKKPERKKWLKYLQDVFNIYIRLRDCDENGFGQDISTGKILHFNNSDAGHFIPVKRSYAVRYDEMNVHAQRRYLNRFSEGDHYNYGERLKKIYGENEVKALQMRSRKRKTWALFELKAMHEFYVGKVLELIEQKDFEVKGFVLKEKHFREAKEKVLESKELPF